MTHAKPMIGGFWLLLSITVILSINPVLFQILAFSLVALVVLLMLYFWVASIMKMRQNGFKYTQCFLLPLLTIAIGSGIGCAALLALQGDRTGGFVLGGVCCLAAIGMTAYPPMQYQRQLATYQRNVPKFS